MKKYAVIENNKVVNIVVDPGQDELDTHPDKYIDYTDGWTFPEGIDGGIYFPNAAEAE